MLVTEKPKPSEEVVPARAPAAEGCARASASDSDLDSGTGRTKAPSRRVLFMDDDARRVEVFLDRCPEAVWVKSAEACIARLKDGWDEVHLDHDLGGERYVDPSRDDCGMAVVRWLCAEPRPQHRDTRFFIHSFNFSAASMMVECLLRNGYTAEFRPFGFDLVDLLSFEDVSPEFVRRAARSRRRRTWRVRLRGLTRRLKRLRRLLLGDRL